MKDINSISELTSIISSRAYRKVLDERREYLQKEANRFIREQDWYGAYACVLKMDDLHKTLEMLEKKLEDIKKEK